MALKPYKKNCRHWCFFCKFQSICDWKLKQQLNAELRRERNNIRNWPYDYYLNKQTESEENFITEDYT